MKFELFWFNMIDVKGTLCLQFLSCQQDEDCKARG